MQSRCRQYSNLINIVWKHFSSTNLQNVYEYNECICIFFPHLLVATKAWPVSGGRLSVERHIRENHLVNKSFKETGQYLALSLGLRICSLKEAVIGWHCGSINQTCTPVCGCSHVGTDSQALKSSWFTDWFSLDPHDERFHIIAKIIWHGGYKDEVVFTVCFTWLQILQYPLCATEKQTDVKA